MSTGDRVERAVAIPIIAKLLKLLAMDDVKFTVAGSTRRMAQTIGDVEMVVSGDIDRLWARLDTLCIAQTIAKTIDEKGNAGTWGPLYRKFQFEGIKFDIFVANEHNRGYILWLRTGPADANTFVMTALSWLQSPIRAKDGFWWMDNYKTKLSVPDEQTLFDMLNLPYVEPKDRSQEWYERHLKKGWSARVDKVITCEPDLPPPTMQRLLF